MSGSGAGGGDEGRGDRAPDRASFAPDPAAKRVSHELADTADDDENEAARLRERRSRLARTFRTMLVISLIAHSFFLPTPWTKALLALVVASSSRDLSFVPLDDEAVLPFDVELLGPDAPPAAVPPTAPTSGDTDPAGVAPPAIAPSAKSAPPPKPTVVPTASVIPPKKKPPRADELDGGKIDDTPDAAPDADLDAGSLADAGPDADASPDAAGDAGPDADAALDAGPIAVADAGPDADASVDAGPIARHDLDDAGVDAGPSAAHPSPDAGPGPTSGAGGAGSVGGRGSAGAPAVASSNDATPVKPVRDPIGISGKAGSIAGKDPNVSLLLGMDAIRSHPAGSTLGPMFANLPIWNQFFTGSGVDPVKDLDRILVAGPQFRESSKVVAVVKLKMKEAAIHDVLEGIRTRATPPGEWESNTVMTAVVDKTKRVFVMQGSGVLMVVPDSLGDTARQMKGAAFPGKKGEAIVVFLKFPGKALRGAPFTIPASLRWVRLATTLAADGSATTEIDALDTSPDQAERSADVLTAGLEAATTREVPLLGTVRMIDRVVFRAVGDHVQGTLQLNPAQARELAKLVAQGAANLGGPPPK